MPRQKKPTPKKKPTTKARVKDPDKVVIRLLAPMAGKTPLQTGELITVSKAAAARYVKNRAGEIVKTN
jgi:hypothetical protein